MEYFKLFFQTFEVLKSISKIQGILFECIRYGIHDEYSELYDTTLDVVKAQVDDASEFLYDACKLCPKKK